MATLTASSQTVHPDAEFTSLVAEAEGETVRGPRDGVSRWWTEVALLLGGLRPSLRRFATSVTPCSQDRRDAHEDRHTFASLMIAAGVNAKAVQEFMGHSKIQTTFDVYGHMLPGSHDEVRERMDAYMLDAGETAPSTRGLPDIRKAPPRHGPGGAVNPIRT